jgi:hypothetical protein
MKVQPQNQVQPVQNLNQPQVQTVPPSDRPQTYVSLPQQVVDQLSKQQVGTVVQTVETAASDVKKHYKNPAFWSHLAVQALIWLSYFEAVDPSLKITAVVASFGSLAAYLFHLAVPQ